MVMLPTLAQFCERRDYFQALRRLQALPQLRADKTALKREIDLLARQRDSMSKHDRHAIEGSLKAIWKTYSEVTGQLAMIEGDKYMMALMAQIESEAA